MTEMIYPLTKTFEVEYVPRRDEIEVYSNFEGVKDIRIKLHAQITAKIGIQFPEPNRPILVEEFISQTQAAEFNAKAAAINTFIEITQSAIQVHGRLFIIDKNLQKLCYSKAFSIFKLYDISIENAFEVPFAKFVGADALNMLNINPAKCTVPLETLSVMLEIGPKKTLVQNLNNQTSFNGNIKSAQHNSFNGFNNFGNFKNKNNDNGKSM